MSETVIRGYAAGDEAAVMRLWNQCLPADPTNMERFAAKVLLDVNFDPEGFLVAVHDTEVVGFALAITRGTPMQGLDVESQDGWITVFFVHPSFRRRRLGQALLDRARAHVAARGRTYVGISPYAPNYFWPGIDQALYPEALRLVQSLGFETIEEPVSMAATLVGFNVPEQVHALQRRREAEGYAFGTLQYSQIAGVLAFNTRVFTADWARAVREALLRGVSRDRVLVASHGNQIVGFCIYGGYDNVAERFGPFGIDSERRRLGLGRVLLYRCLDLMHAEGLHNAWFLWTGRDDPAGYLYRSAGFTESRAFTVLRAPAAIEST